MSLLAVSTPDVSQEVLDKLEKAFTAIVPIPNVHTLEEIMYSAGQRSVVEWMKSMTTRRTITGHAL